MENRFEHSYLGTAKTCTKLESGAINNFDFRGKKTGERVAGLTQSIDIALQFCTPLGIHHWMGMEQPLRPGVLPKTAPHDDQFQTPERRSFFPLPRELSCCV